jgi:hypothetical protein
MARPRLLRARAKPPRHSNGDCGSTPRTFPACNRADARTPRDREIHGARHNHFRIQSICPNCRSEHGSGFGAAFQFARINRFRTGPPNALAICNEPSSKIRCRDFQLRTSRSWCTHLHSPEAEMRCVPGEIVLPRKESGCNPGKEIETRNEATHRSARIDRSARPDSAPAIPPPMARNVDLAARYRLLKAVAFSATASL